VATITTSQTFDSAARTAGEAFTINSGAIFTIDSDTSHHVVYQPRERACGRMGRSQKVDSVLT